MRYKTLLRVLQISVSIMLGILLLQVALLNGAAYSTDQIKLLLTISTLILLFSSLTSTLSGFGVFLYWIKHEVRVHQRHHV